MGALSRTKGHDFERWLAKQIREAFPLATVRRSDQGYGAYEPDVVIEGDKPLGMLWLECECARRPNPGGKLLQAERDCAKRGRPSAPVVVWRKHAAREANATMRVSVFDWLTKSPAVRREGENRMMITMSWGDFLDLLRAAAASTGEP